MHSSFSRSLFLLVLAAWFAAVAPGARAQDSYDPQQRPSYEAWSKGREAAKAGKLEAALAAFAEAVRQEPSNAEFYQSMVAARYALAQKFTDRAERAMLNDDLLTAGSLLRKALAYDPTDSVARDRLRQLQRQGIEETAPTVPEYESVSPRLEPQAGTANFRFRGDTRGAYIALAAQFGLSVFFDEDATHARIQFALTDVDFWTASRILGQQTGTFIRALDSHSFMVINDTQQKRKEYLPQVERTLILPESDKPDQVNEIVRAVREIGGLTHTQLNNATHALTIRGPEHDVALATALLRQLEQPHGEVVLEIDVLEVNRNSAENLGLVPPSSAQVVSLSKQQIQLAQQSTEGLVQVIQELFGTPSAFSGASTGQISTLLATGTTSLSSLVPPLIAFGGGQTVFLATLPGATLNFADQISAVRGAQRILLRASDGEPASFFVGDRYPINFSTLSSAFTSSGNVPAIGFQAYATGLMPQGVASAALVTNNTALDIVTANQNAGTVSVLIGNGDGTFQTNVDYPAGTNPVAVATGAFHGASNPLDVAVVDQGGNNLLILQGNGDGTFKAPVAFAVGTHPAGLLVADFNADGNLDVAVTNTNDNTISILLGNGDGTFQPATTINVTNGQAPVGIAGADFNNDGFADLLVANSASNNVTILFGDGHGGFPSQTEIAAGTMPVAVATADFNSATPQVNPGATADFIVANETDGTVSLFLNDGKGNFTSRTDFTVGNSPVALVAADLNNDGFPDILAANSADDNVSVLFGAGDGTFPANATLPVGRNPAGIATGDFNADGLVDAAVTNRDDSAATIIINSQQLASALPQQPYPGFQYEDIGIKAKATPRIHPSGDVTINLEFEIRSLEAVSFNGIPVISNRTIAQTVRLHENEPCVISGIFADQQTLSVTGWPGVTDLPGLNRILSDQNPMDQSAELVVMVTPRNLRLIPHSARPLYAGRERQSGVPTGAVFENEPEPVPTPITAPPPGGEGERPNRQPEGPTPVVRPQPQPQPQPQTQPQPQQPQPQR